MVNYQIRPIIIEADAENHPALDGFGVGYNGSQDGDGSGENADYKPICYSYRSGNGSTMNCVPGVYVKNHYNGK